MDGAFECVNSLSFCSHKFQSHVSSEHHLPMEPLPKLSSEVVATVLYPFINPLVASIGITHGDDKKIGYYAGVIVRDSSDMLNLQLVARN